MVINVGKSELHAWGDAPHAIVYVRHQGKTFTASTVTKDGVPHACHKYLGVLCVTDYSSKVMLSAPPFVPHKSLPLRFACTYRRQFESFELFIDLMGQDAEEGVEELFQQSCRAFLAKKDELPSFESSQFFFN